jgi:hypothetical protein
LCAALAVLHVVAFLTVALLRMPYPYELEWMEGGQLVQSYEILAGRFPFRAPSADYLPFPYQPFYAALVAALASVAGLSLPLARSVSIVATLISSVLIGGAVAREAGVRPHGLLAGTGARAYGLLAAAMSIALYKAVDFWFDLARVDSLFMALLIGSLYAAKYVKGAWRACLVSAGLMVLAYKTKQLALPFCVLVPPVLYSKRPSAAFAYLPLVLAPLAVDYWIEQRASGGWFSFYVNHVPMAWPYVRPRFLGFPKMVAWQVPVLAAFLAVATVRLLRERSWLARLQDTWTLATFFGMVATVAAWARPGGWANNFMPTYMLAVIPAFVEIHRFARRANDWQRLSLYGAISLQFLRLVYNPVPEIPRRADYEAGAMLVDRLRSAGGPVLVPQRPWLGVLAGTGPSYHANAFVETALRALGVRVLSDLRERLRGGFYKLVVLEADPRTMPESDRVVPDEMLQNYVCDPAIELPGRGLAAFSGDPEPGPRVLCRYAPGGGE